MLNFPLKQILAQQLVKDSFKVIFLRGLGVVILFGVTLYITNFFEPKIVGEYDSSRAILFIFGSLALLGLNQASIFYAGYFTAKDTINSLKKLYFQMLKIISISALILLLFVQLLGKDLINGFYEKEIFTLVSKTSLVFGFHAITMLNIDFFRAIGKIKTSEIYRNIHRYLFFGLGAVILVFVEKTTHLADLFLLNYFMLGIISGVQLIFNLKKLPKTPNLLNIPTKQLIKRSYPMSISLVAFLLLQSTDIILLGKFGAFEEVAYYAVAVKLALVVSTVTYAINAVYAPKIAELYTHGNFEKLSLQVKKATRMIGFFSLPALVFSLLFSTYILSFFGELYTVASSSFKILLLGQFVNVLTGTVGMVMNMTGNQTTLQWILLCAVVLNFILNYYLIPIYGMEGAAFATSSLTIAWNMLSAFLLYKKTKIKTILH